MLVQGKKVLLTGGSRGIGKALVQEYLREGASVWYLGLSRGDSAEYEALAKEGGGSVAFRECDVADGEVLTAEIGRAHV